MTDICHMSRRATGTRSRPTLQSAPTGQAPPRATRRRGTCGGVSDAWPCAEDLVREGGLGPRITLHMGPPPLTRA